DAIAAPHGDCVCEHTRGVPAPKGGAVITRKTLALGTLAALVTVGAAVTVASAGIPSGYKGVEAKLPTQYPVPTKKSGTKCTIGFQNPTAQNETLDAWQKGVQATAKVYGCKVIALDDKLS